MSTNSDSKAWKPEDSTAASYDVFFFFKRQRGKLGLEPPMKSSTFSSLASLDRSYMYIYIYTCMCAKLLQSCLTLFDSTDWACHPLCPWDSPGKNTGVGCCVLLQGVFPTLGWNCVSCSSCIPGGFFTIGPPGKPTHTHMYTQKFYH